MISKKAVDLIIKKTDSKFKERRQIYFLIIGWVIVVLTVYYFNRDMPVDKLKTMLVIVILITSLFLAFFYLMLNFANVAKSLKIVSSSIDEGVDNTGRAGMLLSYQNIKEMDPGIMKHPSTLFTIGNILLNEGYSFEGHQLIEKAKSLDSHLHEIQMRGSLKQEDARYLKKRLGL